MNMQKKEWTKPILIIIGRGEPEEAVLNACKTSELSETGPSKSKICTDNTANCEKQFNS